jgi:hypothetical protein
MSPPDAADPCFYASPSRQKMISARYKSECRNHCLYGKQSQKGQYAQRSSCHVAVLPASRDSCSCARKVQTGLFEKYVGTTILKSLASLALICSGVNCEMKNT